MKDNKVKMMRKVLVLAVAAGLSFSQSALADTQLNITGTIKASPCTVDGDGGSGINVNLGDNIQAATLATSASGSDWVPFTLKLKDCPATTQSVVASFSGLVADESATLYKNNGDATRVQIELQDADGNNRGSGTSMTQTVNGTSHEALFPLQARAYSSAGGATPGTILGTVMVAFTWQ